MTEAERRAANRRRVAMGSDHAVEKAQLSPYTGAEVLYLSKLNPHIGGRGKTDYEGGWQATKADRLFGSQKTQQS